MNKITEVEIAAQTLNGRSHPLRLTFEEREFYTNLGIVILYPYSDGMICAKGAIVDATSCYQSKEVFLSRDGFFELASKIEDNPPENANDILKLAKKMKSTVKIKTKWNGINQHPSWTCEIPVLHSTFELVEEGKVFGVCAVFSVEDLPKIQDQSQLREKLADIQHAIWSHWIQYQFGKCVKNPDGSLTIPPSLAGRWELQSITDYNDLTEKEKESDRHQADKIIKALEELEQHDIV